VKPLNLDSEKTKSGIWNHQLWNLLWCEAWNL